MEVNIYGRRICEGREDSGMEVRCWRSSCRDCYRSVSRGSKLVFSIFLFFYFADVVMTSYGLMHGLYQHYNPVGIWIYQNLTIFGFLAYRMGVLLITTFFFVFFIRFGIKLYTWIHNFAMVYTYLCAVIWDLWTLGYPQLYNMIPGWILGITWDLLSMVFRVVGL